MKKQLNRLINSFLFRKTILILLFLGMYNSMPAQEKKGDTKKVWYSLKDSVPAYKSKNLDSEILYYVKKDAELKLRPSYDKTWAEISPSRTTPKSYIPLEYLGYYLLGSRNYEVIVDSVIGKVLIKAPSNYRKEIPSDLTQTFYKGDVLKMHRAYENHYQVTYQDHIDDVPGGIFSFSGNIDKNALKPTDKEPNTYFEYSVITNHIRENYLKATAPDRVTHHFYKGIGIAIIALSACCFFFIHFSLIPRYLKNRSRSNALIGAIGHLGSIFLIYVIGSYLWALTNGFTALVLVVICLLLLLGAILLTSSRLESRCSKCGAYGPDVTFSGKTKDGTKWEYDYSTNRIKDCREESISLVVETVDTRTWTESQYQMYADNYKCTRCNHKWKIRKKGGLILSATQTRTETETRRINR